MAGTGAAPLAAICTPVYNGEKYLAETLDCVQAQTYPNLVHVILDNASTDATPEIIERYRNGRVPLLVARNPSTVSLNENFNRVMSHMPADAAYFCLLCADDLMFPTAMERMIGVLERHPDVGLVATSEPNPVYHGWPEGEVFDGKTMIRAFFEDKLPTAFARCVFRREHYDARAPLFYDPHLNNCDVDTGLAVMCRANIGYVHQPQVATRVHEASVTSREFGRWKMYFPEWLVFLERYGAIAMGEQEARALARRFKRHYLRRLLRWRFIEGETARFERHLERLADCAVDHPTAAEYIDAVLDWPMLKLNLRPAWDMHPRW